MASIIIVGSTCCNIAPSTLKTSPASHITRNERDNPSPDRRRKFSMICGEKTTSQQAIEILPVMPEIVSAENWGPVSGGAILSIKERMTEFGLAFVGRSVRHES